LPPEAFVGQDIGFLASGNGFREFVQNFFAGDQSEALYELKSISADRSYLIVAQKYDQNRAAFLIGIDITEQTRTIEQGGQIPAVNVRGASRREVMPKAIALTAFAGAENEQRILKAGFQLFIAKPIDPMELVNKVVETLKT
jgi:CheY-like chemotaxis protein